MKHISSLLTIRDLVLGKKDSALILEAVRGSVAVAAYDTEAQFSLRQILRQCKPFPVKLPNGMGLSLPRRFAADYLMQLALEQTDYAAERHLATILLGLIEVPEVIPRMLILAESPWPEIRREAIVTLRSRAAQLQRYQAELTRLLEQESETRPLAALLELIESVNPELTPAMSAQDFWLSLLDRPDFDLRAAVYRILYMRGQAAEFYAEAVGNHLTQDLPIDLRIFAIATIKKIVTSQTEPIRQIADCLRIKNERVAEAVFVALAALGPRAKAALPQITLAMLGRNFGRRILATQAAERLLESDSQDQAAEDGPKLLLLGQIASDRRQPLLEMVRLRVARVLQRQTDSALNFLAPA